MIRLVNATRKVKLYVERSRSESESEQGVKWVVFGREAC